MRLLYVCEAVESMFVLAVLIFFVTYVSAGFVNASVLAGVPHVAAARVESVTVGATLRASLSGTFLHVVDQCLELGWEACD